MILQQKFETLMQQALLKEMDEGEASTWMTRYRSAVIALAPIWNEISRAEPDLTDHSQRHVANVLKNAYYLLGTDSDLSGIEMYLLAVIILFHDVGNLKGREEHNRKIGEIYDSVRPSELNAPMEKVLVMSAVAAHCGYTLDGSPDTLSKLGETNSSLDGHSVRLRSLAAVLRFADELAEGPQRTCLYALNRGMYAKGSRIFHAYASISQVHIDKPSGRINLVYNIPVDIREDRIVASTDFDLSSLLTFTYNRILKLDEERRYTSYYTEQLTAFKRTEATFNFLVGNDITDLGLNTIVLKDLVVPGDDAKRVEDWSSAHRIEAIEAALRQETIRNAG